MIRTFGRLALISFFSLGTSVTLMADTLWEQALLHTAPDDISVLTGMTMEGYQANKSGEVIKTSTMEFSVDSGTGEMTLISAFEDGKDVTEKERRRAERDQAERQQDSEYVHPIFDPTKAEGLRLDPAGFEAVIHGVDCVVYDFVFEDIRKMGPGSPKRIVEEGRVYLDSTNGMPLRLQSRMVEGPNSLKEMNYEMEAFAGPDGTWRPGSIDMEFTAQMIIYMAGGFTMNFIYSDLPSRGT